MKNWVSFLCGLLIAFTLSAQPHKQAHAHNDYAHQRPLQEALENGFTSIEVDIFLHRGKLIVAHLHPLFKRKRTLQNLYLDPLKSRVEENNGKIYPGWEEPVVLMIDFKRGGWSMYEQLIRELEPYQELFCHVEQGKWIEGPLKIVLSGGRPSAEQLKDQPQWVWLDGRPSDFSHDDFQDQIAWVSDRYGKHFTWKGAGEMPEAEQQKLREFVQNAHERNAQVRFWATPEDPVVWEQLLDAGVDRISTDDLAGLATFLAARNK